MTTTVYRIGRQGSPVHHYGVFAYDRPEQNLFDGSGRFIPMCSQRRVEGSWGHVKPDEGRRLCSRCRDLLKGMVADAGLVQQ